MLEEPQNEINQKKVIDEKELNNNINNTVLEQQPENKMDNLLTKMKHSVLIAYKLDYYGNSIPLGSFCYAISFILYGFYECKIHKQEDSLLYTTILLFGGVGQITAGIFEYIKSRTFPCALYFLFGLYFLSFFVGKYYENTIFNEKYQRIFYGSWACLSFPLYLASFKTNIFLSIQMLAVVGFFIIKCIGVCFDIKGLTGIASGILELVSGFSSLYICFGQILNQHYRFQLFPAIPFMKDNEIDNIDNILK